MKNSIQNSVNSPSKLSEVKSKESKNNQMQKIAFLINYSPINDGYQNIFNNQLEVNLEVAAHVNNYVKELYKSMNYIVISTSNPKYLSNGVIEYLCEIQSNHTSDGEIRTETSTLAQSIISFAESLSNTAEMFNVGDKAFQDCLNKKVNLPTIKIASSVQNVIATIKDDGNVYVSDKNYAKNCKELHSLLKSTERVNTLGYEISIVVGKNKINIPTLSLGSTKTNWHAFDIQKIVCQHTGYFKIRHEGEYIINGKAIILSTLKLEYESYKKNYKTMDWVLLELELSRPGNPFHIDQIKYGIVETLNYFESPPKYLDNKQEELVGIN